MLDDRLALVCLRAVVQDLEASGGAGEVLARVLSRTDASGTIARSVAPVVHREVKPANVLLAPKPKRASKPRRKVEADGLQPDGEGARLAAALVEAHGGALAAARAVPTSAGMLKRWRVGFRPAPTSIERLRVALEAIAPATKSPAAAKPKAARKTPRLVVDAPSGQRFGARVRGGHRLAALRDIQADADEQAVDVDAPELEDDSPEPRQDDSPAGVVRALIARHGPPEELAARFGLKADALVRWLNGGACSPSALGRLKAALASGNVSQREEATSAPTLGAGEEGREPAA